MTRRTRRKTRTRRRTSLLVFYEYFKLVRILVRVVAYHWGLNFEKRVETTKPGGVRVACALVFFLCTKKSHPSSFVVLHCVCVCGASLS